MDIRCRKTGCRFNAGQTCKAKYVEISSHTVCNSFVRGGDDKDFARLMFETAPEFANSRHIRTVNLHCGKTHCLFNSFGKCSANGITVLNDKQAPRCGTFIESE